MSTSKRRRIRIEEGIYRDRNFLLALVRTGQRAGVPPKRKKYPLGTELRTIRAWRARSEAELLEVRPGGPADGSLTTDVPLLLNQLPAGRRKEDFAILLQHWIDSPLGAEPRDNVTREMILEQRAKWLEAGAAIVTVNHRVRALRALYDGLDGLDATHPTDKIKYLPPPRPEPRSIPVAYVEDILAAIPDRGRAARFGTRPDYSELKIRLIIMAWTGIPPIQLERLRPRDVDLVHGRMYLQPRRKGKGSPGAWVALLPAAMDAFREYARVGLWGRSFSRSSMAKSWKGAIKRVLADLEREATKTNDRTAVETFRDAIPPRCRPYDLRHAFATEAYRVTGDLRAVAELLQHANLETTKRYTGGAVSERVTSAIAKMAHASQGPRATPAPAAPRLVKESTLRSVK